MQPNEFEDAKLLWKMFYAGECFKHAQAAAEHLLKAEIEQDDPLFYPLVTAVYVLYGKPFRTSQGVGKLEEEIVPAEHLELHRLLLQHRDQVYAHTDATSFELPECGPANQVRVLHLPTTNMQLFGTQFCARPPLLPSIVELCRQLQEKTEYHEDKLFERYRKEVPNQVGEYAVNVYEQAGDFFTAVKPMFLVNDPRQPGRSVSADRQL